MRRAALPLVILFGLLFPSIATAQSAIYVGRLEWCPSGRLIFPCQSLWAMNPSTGRLFARFSGVGWRAIVPASGTKVYASQGTRLLAVDMANGAWSVVTLPSGATVSEIVAARDRTRVYVSDSAAAAVYVVRAADDQLVQTISVDAGANTMAVSRDGALLAVVNRLAATVSIVSTTTSTILRTIPVDANPLGIEWSLDGSRLYVASQDAKTVATFQVSTGGLLDSITTATVPTYLALAANGSRLFVTFAAAARGAGFVAPDSSTYSTLFTAAGLGIIDTTAGTLSLVPGVGGVGEPPLVSEDDTTVVVPTKPAASQGGTLTFLEAASGAIQKTLTVALRQTFPPGLESDTSFNAVRLALVPPATCLFEITAGTQAFPPAGGSGSVSLPAPAGCPWSVQSQPGFVSLNPPSGIGPSTIAFDVGPLAAGVLKGRTADIRVNNQPVTVSQTVSQMFLDEPADGVTVERRFTLRGWAVDSDGVIPFTPLISPSPRSGIDRIRVFASPIPDSGAAPVLIAEAPCVQGMGPYNTDCDRERSDVQSAYGFSPQFSRPGYQFTINTLLPGMYRLTVKAHRVAWNDDELVRTVDVRVTGTPAPLGYIDHPVAGTVPSSFVVDGWAIDPAAGFFQLTGINVVHVWAFPVGGGAPVFLGVPELRRSRPDIAAVFGFQFDLAGFRLDVAGLAPGTYQVVAYPHSFLTGTFVPTNVVTVTVLPPVSNPAMALDSPTNNFPPVQTFMAAGWAVDLGAPSGTGVDAVHVWAFPVSGGAPIFVDAGTYGGSRPDVGAAFGSRFTNSGYTFTIANLLSGVYDLGVYAHSTVTGTFNQQRFVRITIK